MAYQNVGTPRFYVNVIEWLASNFAINTPSWAAAGLFNTLPVTQETINLTLTNGYFDNNIDIHHNGFVAFLGHTNLNEIQIYSVSNIIATNMNEVVNCGADVLNTLTTQISGFTIVELKKSEATIRGFYFTEPTNVGSLVVGNYYDMPHSPDLSLTMTREMDGVKRIRTKGGSDLVKHQYIKPAMWGNLGAWELKIQSAPYPYSDELSHSGRRIWDLSFSYLQDKDVFPEVSTLSTHESRAYAHSDFEWYSDIGSNTEEFGLLRDNGFGNINFYAEVIHKTNGGQLPFIFQPNKDDNTQFAICKFDMKSFKFEQVANGVYNMKLKIREVW